MAIYAKEGQEVNSDSSDFELKNLRTGERLLFNYGKNIKEKYVKINIIEMEKKEILHSEK